MTVSKTGSHNPFAFVREDGPNLVALASNGWADAEPAWRLKSRAQPDATTFLPTGTRALPAFSAYVAERERI
jgi:hypothetical protein